MWSTFSLNSHNRELVIQFSKHTRLIQFCNNIASQIRLVSSSVYHIELHHSPVRDHMSDCSIRRFSIQYNSVRILPGEILLNLLW